MATAGKRRADGLDAGVRAEDREREVKPMAIDLFCGLGGWTDGLLAEDYDVIGFDIERHVYGEHRYPAQLVIQDVRTLHGAQFRDADLIVASPPCQGYSYRAMPWKRAKALPAPDNTLFEACFRIQREACEAAGRHIPLIVENVRGAQKWVGRARWNYGSFYLWGDVPALMPITFKAVKVPSFRFDGSGRSFQTASVRRTNPGKGARFTSRDCGDEATAGVKSPGLDWNRFKNGDPNYRGEAFNPAARKGGGGDRKMASAMIAKIPLPLSRYIAATFRPMPMEEAAE
jgi:C-5 cytosine-specific DNA methylase